MNYIKLSDGRVLASESIIEEIDKVDFSRKKATDELNKEIEKTQSLISAAKMNTKLARILFYGGGVCFGTIVGLINPIGGIIVLAIGGGIGKFLVTEIEKDISGDQNKLDRMIKIRNDNASRDTEEDRMLFKHTKENEIYSFDEGLSKDESLSIKKAYDIGYRKVKVKRYVGKHLK